MRHRRIAPRTRRVYVPFPRALPQRWTAPSVTVFVLRARRLDVTVAPRTRTRVGVSGRATARAGHCRLDGTFRLLVHRIEHVAWTIADAGVGQGQQASNQEPAADRQYAAAFVSVKFQSRRRTAQQRHVSSASQNFLRNRPTKYGIAIQFFLTGPYYRCPTPLDAFALLLFSSSHFMSYIYHRKLYNFMFFVQFSS